MKILHGMELHTAIRKLLEEAEWAMIAVAYWGIGATDKLIPRSLDGSKTVIACDFMSGACNPKEIATLIDRVGKLTGGIGKGKPFAGVGKQAKLHAKVWITDKAAIIGSSNASSNGLGEEGAALLRSIEANLYVDDRATLNALENWFIENIKPELITDTDFKRVIALRKQPPRKPLPNSVDILSALQEDPAIFDNDDLWIWIWQSEDYSAKALKRLEKERDIREDRRITQWEGASHLPPGSHVIHFEVEEGKAHLDGVFRILLEDEFIEDQELLLAKEVKQFRQMPLGSKKQWEQAAARALVGKHLPLSYRPKEFAKKFLR